MAKTLNDLPLTAKLNRRSVLKGAAGAAAVGAIGGTFPMPAIAEETTWTLANSLRSVANPYHATFAKGGEDFAKSIGAKYEVLVTEGNSEKGIADIKALLQRTGGKLILNVDPNDCPMPASSWKRCRRPAASSSPSGTSRTTCIPGTTTRTTSPTCPSTACRRRGHRQ